MGEITVYVVRRKLSADPKRKRRRGRGKDPDGNPCSYHLKWLDPTTQKWKSKKAGSDDQKPADQKRAEAEALNLQEKLEAGTYRHTKHVSWQDFTADHVRKIKGKANAGEAERVLKEFGGLFGDPQPNRVTYAMIEDYVQKLAGRTKNKNTQATVNKKLRYLRSAFNRGIKRGYLARNPMEGWEWVSEEEVKPRIVSEAEEAVLLDKGEELYGFRMRAFVVVALGTGGRRGELLNLGWENIDLEDGSLWFTETKGKRDRQVPFNPDVGDVLLRLRVQTQQAGGPFIGMGENLGRAWGRIRKAVGLPDVSIHDLRRTYGTRLAHAGVPMVTVQELLGHARLETTRKYYVGVEDAHKRAGVAKLRKGAAG